MAATSIKVSVELRDRINRDARARGTTAAGFLESLLDGYERRRRMESFGAAFRANDREYWDEFHTWDVDLGE
ncbi:toxin-antitoxin system protein [Leucobacter insecticola]|uniref:Toxin-antitoxin system protein n=1 Tax=Leucobacter insecticola TaxID=2714934 RepID=A0A6G8FIX5_9MICO|nr:toxin-antitoxin system protein [Leucobacter insecticola]QIM16301.1 toxin-antitoxin system protein [Leucobacter insecticola]